MDIDQEFNKVVNELSDDQWWEWVKNWLDVDFIIDIYKNWDTEIKKDEIKIIKEIIKKKQK